MVDNTYFKILNIKELTEDTYVLRVEKNDLIFQAGQYISLGLKDDFNAREYSIYSPENANYLEVLIKEVPQGYLSPKLKSLKEDDFLNIEGPFGYFTIEREIKNKKFYFIASGTGISPFHSLVLSNKDLDYKLIHGIKYKKQKYESEIYGDNYIACISQENNENDFNGRLTKYLLNQKLENDAYYYLCGNCDMIYEVYDILQDNEVPIENIKTEVYF